MSAFPVKQEPLSSDDEFSEVEKNSSSLNSNFSNAIATATHLDSPEPSTSSGTSKSNEACLFNLNVAQGFKLNATPVVILERLDPKVLWQRGQLRIEASNSSSTATGVYREQSGMNESSIVDSEQSGLKRSSVVNSEQSGLKRSIVNSEQSGLKRSSVVNSEQSGLKRSSIVNSEQSGLKRSSSVKSEQSSLKGSSSITSEQSSTPELKRSENRPEARILSSVGSDLKVEKFKLEAAVKTVPKPLLAIGDHHLSEQSLSLETSRYELTLNPIAAIDLMSEPFRKFMNLALDCAVHFRKNQNQPLFGNISLYFGDFITLQSAMQRLCQLPVAAQNVRLNGTIRCYDFNKLSIKTEDEPAKRCLTGRLMFQFCAQRIEKLKQLASVKDRKKESTKMRGALIHKIPATLSKEMLLLLFPFSLDVRMPGEKQLKGVIGPVNVDFESQDWMEAVLDCMRDQSVNLSSPSGVELGTFRLHIKNYIAPKIITGNLSSTPNVPSLMNIPVQPFSPAYRGRDRGAGLFGKGPSLFGRGQGLFGKGQGLFGKGQGLFGIGPGPKDRVPSREHVAASDRHDGKNRDKENSSMRSDQKHHDSDRKRPHDSKDGSRLQTDEKRGRFDNQNIFGKSQAEDAHGANQQDPTDPKEVIRQAALAKGLDPNNPDVIKILEMSSELEALQTVRDPHSKLKSGATIQHMAKSGPPQHSKDIEWCGQQRQFGSREASGSPRRFSQQRERGFYQSDVDRERGDAHHRDTGRITGHTQPDQRNGVQGNEPCAFGSHREWGGLPDAQHGGFGTGSRGKEPTGLHGRSRDSPGGYSQHRDRSRSGNRSRSPQRSSSSLSQGEKHQPQGFEQRRVSAGADSKNWKWEPDSGLSGSYVDPNTNDLPLDFQPPTPFLSTEQAVQQDMARTMQALQYGDRDRKQGAAPLVGPGIRQPENHGPPAEELVLPLQFGKNAVKKTPQAIFEEKRQKEHEERQKKELEIKKKREEEERQRREKEMEDRRKKEKGEWEKREKELAEKCRNVDAYFTSGKTWQGQEPQYRDQNREQQGFFNSPRPIFFGEKPGNSVSGEFMRSKQSPKDPKAPLPGVRFQGEGVSFQAGTFQHGPQMVSKDAWQKDDTTSNLRDNAGRPDGTIQRGTPYRPDRGGFHRGDQVLNFPARENFHHERATFERHFPDEKTQNDKPTNNLWNAHDQLNKDASGGPHGTIDVRDRPPRDRWAGEATQNEPPNVWDARVEGDRPYNRILSARGRPIGRRPVGRNSINQRDGYNSFIGEWENTEKEPESTATDAQNQREGFRGRGAISMPYGGRGRGADRDRGMARGGFGFHSEGHQADANWGGPEHHLDNETPGNTYSERVSGTPMRPAYRFQEDHHRDLPQRKHFERRSNEFSYEDKAGDLKNENTNYRNEGYNGNQQQRGGFQMSHSPGHPLRGSGRGRFRAADVKHFDDDWADTSQDQSGQFEHAGFDEDHVETKEFTHREGHNKWGGDVRAQRGRGDALPRRPRRGFMGRGRGVSSFGRGFGKEESLEIDYTVNNKDGRIGAPELQGSIEMGALEPKEPMAREEINTHRGRGFRGRGAPASRGMENRGGRGLSSGRGTEHRGGRGGLTMPHPDYQGSLEPGLDRGQLWEGQFGESHQHDRGGVSMREGPNSRGRGISEWSPGRGIPSGRGTGGFIGRGVALEALRGGAPFRGSARGLFPRPT